MNKKPKAYILSSGGLDSTLICHIMSTQKVEPIIVFFSNPFDMCSGGCSNRNNVKMTAEKLKMEFRTIYMDDEYLRIIENPQYGYGKHMNPCIDCRIYMLLKTKELLNEKNNDFIVTGEVIGQRPMSQFRRALQLIEKVSGLKGKILRPLSAGLLPATIAEQKGLVDRTKLYSMSGRSRKPQLAAAEKFSIRSDEYLTPAGGCRLTMKEYSAKVRDLLENNKKLDIHNVILLGYGRHFRLSSNLKVIVGRDEQENYALEKLVSENDMIIYPARLKGPVCLVIGDCDEKDILLIAGICGGYSTRKTTGKKCFKVKNRNNITTVYAMPVDREQIIKYKI